VQTVDDLLMEHILPGDVFMFDRRCHLCQSPAAALACMTNKRVLTSLEEEDGSSSSVLGKFDHVGVVVPSPEEDEGLGEPYLLEFTPQDGVVIRPLLERLERSRSRTVLLLPLCLPGEHRDPSSSSGGGGVLKNDERTSEKNELIRKKMDRKLRQFSLFAVRSTQQNGVGSMHSFMSIFGSLAYAFKIHETFSSIPVNPSSWVVASALQEAGIAMNVEERGALNSKPEDFLRDHRFNEMDSVRLRPGFRFMRPIPVRENNRR